MKKRATCRNGLIWSTMTCEVSKSTTKKPWRGLKSSLKNPSVLSRSTRRTCVAPTKPGVSQADANCWISKSWVSLPGVSLPTTHPRTFIYDSRSLNDKLNSQMPTMAANWPWWVRHSRQRDMNWRVRTRVASVIAPRIKRQQLAPHVPVRKLAVLYFDYHHLLIS